MQCKSVAFLLLVVAAKTSLSSSSSVRLSPCVQGGSHFAPRTVGSYHQPRPQPEPFFLLFTTPYYLIAAIVTARNPSCMLSVATSTFACTDGFYRQHEPAFRLPV